MLASARDDESSALEAGNATLEQGGRAGQWRCRLGKAARDAFQMDDLGREIVAIALPAAVGLTADPLSSLVDTMFLGRIGPVELAAVGVSISIFNLVSKVFNVPLLNVTTSFVAEDNAVEDETRAERDVQSTADISEAEKLLEHDKQTLPAVTSAITLGAVLGILETATLILGSSLLLDIMGIPESSDMRVPAKKYLTVRALAAPAVVVSLAVQGAFRGFRDTKTPLYATVLGNMANVILDPLLIFGLGFGIYGAAAATIFSEYLSVGVLFWKLGKSIVLFPRRMNDLPLGRFLRSGGLLLIRTVATLLTMTLATSMAARSGSIAMAAHQICLQLWLATSLLSDSFALAGQAIIANALAKGDYLLVQRAAYRVLVISFGFGIAMAILLGTGLWSGLFASLFTHDLAVLSIVQSLTPFVVLTQPINSVAFAFDGLYYGASDFVFAAYSTGLVAAGSSVVLCIGSVFWSLRGIWIGLSIFMCLRVLVGIMRVGTGRGPLSLSLGL